MAEKAAEHKKVYWVRIVVEEHTVDENGDTISYKEPDWQDETRHGPFDDEQAVADAAGIAEYMVSAAIAAHAAGKADRQAAATQEFGPPMEEFVRTIVSQCRSVIEAAGGVYIAVMPQRGRGYDLEIEIKPRDIIGGIWGTETCDLNKARQIADEMEALFRQNGVNVFKTREEWENR